MKIFITVVALSAVFFVFHWFNNNTRACFYAKGAKTVIDQNLIFDGKMTRPMLIGSFSKGDYEACAFIGETL